MKTFDGESSDHKQKSFVTAANVVIFTDFFFCYVDLTYSFQILKKKMDSFGFLSNSGNGGFMGWEGEMSRKKKISSGYLVISANCFKTKCSG